MNHFQLIFNEVVQALTTVLKYLAKKWCYTDSRSSVTQKLVCLGSHWLKKSALFQWKVRLFKKLL